MPGKLYMVVDIESVGLHGEGFAYGYVVIDESGGVLAESMAWCDPALASGTDEDRTWIIEHVMPTLGSTPICSSMRDLRDKFWVNWLRWKALGAEMMADCCWPVETNWLSACVADAPDARKNQGPYPLLDFASALVLVGGDPLAITSRLSCEQPAHNPLNDARQSARQWIELLQDARRGQPLDFARLLEPLAELEHIQWSHWTKWMLDQIELHLDQKQCSHASIGCTAGAWLGFHKHIKQWRRQIRTPYAELSEKEKDSDRKWAHKVIALIRDQITKKVTKPKQCKHEFRVTGGQPGSFDSTCTKCGKQDHSYD